MTNYCETLEPEDKRKYEFNIKEYTKITYLYEAIKKLDIKEFEKLVNEIRYDMVVQAKDNNE